MGNVSRTVEPEDQGSRDDISKANLKTKLWRQAGATKR